MAWVYQNTMVTSAGVFLANNSHLDQNTSFPRQHYSHFLTFILYQTPDGILFLKERAICQSYLSACKHLIWTSHLFLSSPPLLHHRVFFMRTKPFLNTAPETKDHLCSARLPLLFKNASALQDSILS
jgi:hypothetical protein